VTAGRLLAWSLAGGALVQLILWRFSEGRHFSFAFDYLLRVYDAHGNWALLGVAVAAWLLRGRTEVLRLVRFAAERPWSLALLLLPLLCIGSRFVYHAYPLSYDELATAFQAEAFAAGRLAGLWPPDLIDRLVPTFMQGRFLTVSRVTGEVSTSYWPAYALYLTPFYWLGIPWAANPVLGALTIPAVHRLASRLGGSAEAGGWAALLTVASPAFVVTSLSYYSMPAHLLLDLWFAVLLLDPTPRRAALAGVLGSIALTLHSPARHIVFAAPFFLWLAFRPGAWRLLLALVAGYLPLAALLGFGWQYHLAALVAHNAPATGQAGAAAAAPALPGAQSAARVFLLPDFATLQARMAGVTKIWTWGAMGLLVLAAWGYRAATDRAAARVLAASLGTTFLIFFFVGTDQGHGWGNRSIHGAWFVLPVLAAVPLVRADAVPLRAMAAWGLALSLVAADGLRLLQVHSLIDAHLKQVPPLAVAPDPTLHEVVFVDPRHGVYSHDMVRNDPFLRGRRIVMILSPREPAEAVMARRFPQHVKAAEGPWGQRWIAPLR
jgi:hypothetical protein